MQQIISSMQQALTVGDGKYKQVPFGKEMRKQFLFAPGWRNLNHGSYGTFPIEIREEQRKFQDICELAPDTFIRRTFPIALDESREAVAKLLNAPTSTVVLVSNASVAANTVLRNIVWNKDGTDEILYFSTVYNSCGKTIDYVCEANHDLVSSREVHITYPIEDDDLVSAFKSAIRQSRAEGKNPRLTMFDTVSSIPGVRMPFEELTKVCREEGVLSLIDGAHGIGLIPLDLTTLDPDFFLSNIHKWLLIPRGCAVLYVPERNQAMMRSSLPTSHSFEPRDKSAFKGPQSAAVPHGKNSAFVNMFDFLGTVDYTNYLVIPEAIKWRQEACGGEHAIMEYNIHLAKLGANAVARILGTRVLDNSTKTITNSALVTIMLPIAVNDVEVEGTTTVKTEDAFKAHKYMVDTLNNEYQTLFPIFNMYGYFWVRLSAQIYLDLSDFEWAGRTLKSICQDIAAQKYLSAADAAESK